jgi:ATP-dependent Clp protease ATP-binding subunit ClpA
MFERYTEKSIKVIMLAQEESRRLGHNYVGTEQLLLATIGEGRGIGAEVLRSMGVTLPAARIEVEKIIGRGAGHVAIEIPFTPRAKNVLSIAQGESHQLGHYYICTEHLLLGLVRESEGVATKVLERLNVDISDIRNQIIRMLGESSGYSRDLIDTEDDVWDADGRLLENDNFGMERRSARQQYRSGSQDPLEATETTIMLRSILDRTIAIEQSINEMRVEIVALSNRITRIEDKRSEPIDPDATPNP